MARLHVALPYDRTNFRRFLYMSDCVARDVKKEQEDIQKASAMNRRKNHG